MLLMAAGCGGPDRTTTATALRVSAPSPDDGARDCLDVGEHRVCYGPTGAALVRRVLPAGATPAQGWRCD
ncbi:MAG TPA: hypothetical protein VJV78_27290, partial [Polyangiales bacterium]|nr:hypothetical protein [Polyangiales bacterium]